MPHTAIANVALANTWTQWAAHINEIGAEVNYRLQRSVTQVANATILNVTTVNAETLTTSNSTLVAGLNADLLDGLHASDFVATAYLQATFAQNTAVQSSLASKAANTAVYATFAQNTAVEARYAQNTAVYATFAQNTAVQSAVQSALSTLSTKIAVANVVGVYALVGHDHTGVYQPLDSTLTSLAALGTAADQIAYTTGVDTWAEATLTSFARTLLDDANNSQARATLGLATIDASTLNGYSDANTATADTIVRRDAAGAILATAYDTPSDMELKIDVATISSNPVLGLRPVSYRYKDETNVRFGLIAQEAQKVVPSIVKRSPDGYLSLEYQQLIPLLIDTIQELEERVRVLEGRDDGEV